MSGGRPRLRPQNGLGGLTDATRAMSGGRWTYNHPPRGSCQLGCPSWGRCHCCGRRLKKAVCSSTRYGLRAGHYGTFAAGHQTRALIPAEKVMPMVNKLHEAYGTWRAVSHALGIHHSTIWEWRRGRAIKPANARRVLAVTQQAMRGLDKHRWSEIPTAPRLATEKDAALARQIQHSERVLEHQYNIRDTATVREERLARVKRIERERLSIKELVG